MEKGKKKLEKISNFAKNLGKKVIYINQVGGNGELVFEGGSLVISEEGTVIFEGEIFNEDIKTIDLESLFPILHKNEDLSFLYNSLVMGLRDFIKKSGFRKAVIGLSGGHRFCSCSLYSHRSLRKRQCSWCKSSLYLHL